MSNKNSINKIIGLMVLIAMIMALMSFIAFAIPNSLTIQGKLTNLGGTSQVGTFNFTFKIYDNVTNGNELWAVINQSVTTDSNGVYDTILTGLNLSFADQYYLGIAVQGENESTPRINLTSAPYSFRANTSESLNPNASYFVANLSVAGHATIGNGTSIIEISTQRFNVTASGNLVQAGNITLGNQLVFRLGEIIDNLVDGWLKITGALNVTSSLVVGAGANITGDLTVNNTFNVTASSGNVNVGGILDAGNVRILGSNVQVEANAFKISNYSSEYDSTGFKRANVSDYLGGADVNASLIKSTNTTFLNLFSRVVDAFSRANLTDFFGDSGFNGSVLRVGNISNIRESLYNLANFTTNYDARTDRFGLSNLSSALQNNNLSANFSNVSVVSLPLGWTNLTGYPGACPAGQYLTQIDDTLTCTAADTSASDDWNFANNESAVLDNTTIIRTGNLSLIFLERNSSLWNRTGTNTVLRFINDNVGIGTTTPDNLLTILGNELTANAILHLNASDNFNTSVINLIVLDHTLKNPVNSTGGVGISILFRATDNTSQLYKIANISAILYNATNGSQLGALTFSTTTLDTGDNSFGHLVERLRIDGYGRIGINNTAPNETLKVRGTFSVESGSGVQGLHQNPSGNVGIGTTSPVDTLTIIGSLSTFGSLNATFINATEIRQGTNIVQTINAVFNLLNLTNYFGDSGFNGSVLRVGNMSNIRESLWNRGNTSDYLGGAGANESIVRASNMTGWVRVEDQYELSNFTSNLNTQNASLWNRSSTNTVLRFNDDRVGIGTTSPGQALHVVGSSNISATVNAPVVNTTLATQNITITSAAGSVIIRLG